MATVEMTTQQMLIGENWTEAASGRTYPLTFPFTGEQVGVAAAGGREDARAAVEAAHAAFGEWSQSAPEFRRGILLRAGDLLEERKAELAAQLTEENGASLGGAMLNVAVGAAYFREAASHAYGLVGDVMPSDISGRLALGVRAPAGVVLSIAPWNAPFILGVRAVAWPLAFANTVVFKASEQCPRSHAAIAQVLLDAGLPPGVLNVVTNAPEDGPDVVDELISHPATRRINFTGSSHVGRIIAEKAAHHLKRVLLELGGKAPMIVLRDADLDQAAAAASCGAFLNQGQICMSTERILVDRAVVDPLLEKLCARAGDLQVGDPREPGTVIGPLVSAAAVQRVHALVQDAVAKGARVLVGGEPEGSCFPPTVIADVAPGMRLYDEESFGPVVSVISVDGPDEAVRIANDTEYGLSAAVFSQDIPAALEIARRIESGMCHINDMTIQDEPHMPFGGVKASGLGRFGASGALEEFTELRWVTMRSSARQYPI